MCSSDLMAGKINVAIIGVGNCASSLVQGVEYYKNAEAGDVIPGLMHPVLGGYHIRDINFTAAFDVDADKVGKDLSEAIFSGQNNTVKFTDVPATGVTVSRGMTHDGLGKYLSEVITKAEGPTADFVVSPGTDPVHAFVDQHRDVAIAALFQRLVQRRFAGDPPAADVDRSQERRILLTWSDAHPDPPRVSCPPPAPRPPNHRDGGRAGSRRLSNAARRRPASVSRSSMTGMARSAYPSPSDVPWATTN